MTRLLILLAALFAASPVHAWVAPCGPQGCSFILKNNVASNGGPFTITSITVTTPGEGGQVFSQKVFIGPAGQATFLLPESQPCDRAVSIHFLAGPEITDAEQVNFCTIKEIIVLRNTTGGFYSFRFLTQ
jgi:hypothetical protein